MVYPPRYRFAHNPTNKLLTRTMICKILKTKTIIFKIFKTLGLWSLWGLGRHKPAAGGFCLYLTSIIRGVSSGGAVLGVLLTGLDVEVADGEAVDVEFFDLCFADGEFANGEGSDGKRAESEGTKRDGPGAEGADGGGAGLCGEGRLMASHGRDCTSGRAVLPVGLLDSSPNCVITLRREADYDGGVVPYQPERGRKESFTWILK
jgi:hypothetical protein